MVNVHYTYVSVCVNTFIFGKQTWMSSRSEVPEVSESSETDEVDNQLQSKLKTRV